MEEWTPPRRPAKLTEERLIQAILNKDFAPGSTLPGERVLAAQLGVTRPTLREALQRLARDGWIEIRQGKATRVNDIWSEGNLNILSAIANHSGDSTGDLVPDLLEVRLALATNYTYSAVNNQAESIATFLKPYPSLPDRAEVFAIADWELHLALIRASGNFIFMLIYNGFHQLYARMAQRYFALPQARSASRAFYRDLLSAVEEADPLKAQAVVNNAMVESRLLWQEVEG
jgi:GntR family negative regulator for fad regulon and positive regulator of fabA